MLRQEPSCNSCAKRYGTFSCRPLVFVGESRSSTVVARLQRLGWGRMWAHALNLNAQTIWAFDNGAFTAWREGKPFPAQRFKERLERALSVGTPWLAVAPDLVAQGQKSLEFTLSWMPDLPPWPWFLAVQDGMTPIDVEPHADRFSGIFLGGSDAFKAQARMWCGWAHERGLRFHYGRAGTLSKLYEAQQIGADSVDSGFPLWTVERFERFARNWRTGDRRLPLPFGTEP